MSECCGSKSNGEQGSGSYFDQMVPNCLAYAEAAKAEGRPIVGIMCEYTPRELIMAAGGVPVCLCGGSLDMIGPAENDLPANLCPLIKSTYGYHVEKANPFLEMADLIVAETTCDGKKKMYELMAQTRDMVILELPQKPDDPEAFAHWVTELDKLKAHLETRFNTKITHDRLNAAIKTMNRERRARRELAGVMTRDAPPITGRQLLDYKSLISGIGDDLDEYDKALAELTRQTEGHGGRVRVLLTGVPTVHGAERVIDIIEDGGGLIVCMENCTGIKPIWQDIEEGTDDPMRAMARKYMDLPCSVMTANDRRMDLLTDMAKRFKADCIVDLSWQACLTYDVESWRVKRLAETSLHLPYLRISTDYSPSDTARIALRVEALFETVYSRQE
ncbi:MAG: 2-hydroxyacyl-CoA dehydratase [Planctomycetes bacterium]|nr:2-hydroxyacyl-CoA dehydratase [Planctomycetota bacterium]